MGLPSPPTIGNTMLYYPFVGNSPNGLVIDLSSCSVYVNNAAKGEKFITFFAAHYNGKTKTLQYINAGHNYPILVDHQKTKLLNKGCIGLGMLEEIPKIEIEKFRVEPNSILVCYTDGIVELENNNGTPFETENLEKTIKTNL